MTVNQVSKDQTASRVSLVLMDLIMSHYSLYAVSATPILQTCQLVLEGINGSRLHTSCLSVNDTTHVFTNIRPHQLRGMWEGIYIGPSSLPSRPAYIPTNGYSVGVAVSEMTASVFRAASE